MTRQFPILVEQIGAGYSAYSPGVPGVCLHLGPRDKRSSSICARPEVPTEE